VRAARRRAGGTRGRRPARGRTRSTRRRPRPGQAPTSDATLRRVWHGGALILYTDVLVGGPGIDGDRVDGVLHHARHAPAEAAPGREPPGPPAVDGHLL